MKFNLRNVYVNRFYLGKSKELHDDNYNKKKEDKRKQ